jgi:hypothetical protein
MQIEIIDTYPRLMCQNIAVIENEVIPFELSVCIIYLIFLVLQKVRTFS